MACAIIDGMQSALGGLRNLVEVIMAIDKILNLARKNLGGNMESSARVCLEDAISLYDAGEYEAAKKRAIDSLRYSVGIFHADYKRASA